MKEKKQSGLTFGCGGGKELLRSYIRHLLKQKGQQTFSGFVSLAGKRAQIYTFVFSVKGLSSHKCGHKCLEVKFISHTQHYTVNQQSSISQCRELPLNQVVLVCFFPDEETLGGTVVPPEIP